MWWSIHTPRNVKYLVNTNPLVHLLFRIKNTVMNSVSYLSRRKYWSGVGSAFWGLVLHSVSRGTGPPLPWYLVWSLRQGRHRTDRVAGGRTVSGKSEGRLSSPVHDPPLELDKGWGRPGEVPVPDFSSEDTPSLLRPSFRPSTESRL